MKPIRMTVAGLAGALVLALLAGDWVGAGTTGIVSGIVRSADGTPLSGANVIIAGTKLTTVTDAAGHYVITNVPPGDYEVRAEMVGYANEVAAGIQVTMDTTSTVDFEMTQEAIAEVEAVVTRPRPMINADVPSTLNLVTAGQENLTRADPASIRAVPGVISAFPGVIVEPDGSGQMHLRGGRSDQVGYYLEGIPITDPNTGFFSTNLFTTGVNKFQMYTGGFPAEYGNAISGVLNEVKKTGNQLSGFVTDGEGGNRDYVSNLMQVGRDMPSGFNWYAATALQKNDIDGPLVREQKYADSVVKLVWPWKKDSLTVLALQGSLVGWFNDTDFTRQRYLIGAATWSRNFTPDSFLTVRPYYIFSTTVIGTTYGGGAAESDQMGLMVGYTNQLSRQHLLKAGWSLVSSDNSDFMDFPGFELYRYNASVDTIQNAYYVEDTMKLGDKWTLAAGLRNEGIKYDRTGLAYVPGSGYTGAAIGDVTERVTTPRLGLTYAPDEESVWKANWGKYSKFVPALNVQRIYYNPDDPYAEAMQAGLGATEPQRSELFELSYERQLSDSFALRMTPFYGRYRNLLQSYVDLGTGITQYSNLGKGKSHGLELLARKRLTGNWEGWFSYTYQKTRVNAGSDSDYITGAEGLFYAPWDQRHTISLVANYTTGQWSHGLRADFGSGRADIVTPDVAAAQGRANPSVVLTYNLSYKLPRRAGSSVYLSVYNILNTHQTLQFINDGSSRSSYAWVPKRFISIGTSQEF